jgi:hypothetical protein
MQVQYAGGNTGFVLGFGTELKGPFVARFEFFALLTAVTGCFGQIESNAPAIGQVTLQELLTTICPGHTTDSGCSVCPPDTAMAGGGLWEIQSTCLGHYLSPSSKDAFVTGTGCEAHAQGTDGSFLLTRAGNSWRKVHYLAGTRAHDCRQLAGSDGHDRLVCADADLHEGHMYTSLALLDPGRGPTELSDRDLEFGKSFFGTMDDSGAGPCHIYVDDVGEGELQSGFIDRVNFTSLESKYHVRIVVYERSGSMKISPMLREQVCSGAAPEPDIKRIIKLSRYEFIFDGIKIVPVKP